MVQRNHGLDAGRLQRVEQLVVVAEGGRVEAPLGRLKLGPFEAEAVGVAAQLPHQLHVVAVALPVLARAPALLRVLDARLTCSGSGGQAGRQIVIHIGFNANATSHKRFHKELTCTLSVDRVLPLPPLIVVAITFHLMSCSGRAPEKSSRKVNVVRVDGLALRELTIAAIVPFPATVRNEETK